MKQTQDGIHSFTLSFLPKKSFQMQKDRISPFLFLSHFLNPSDKHHLLELNPSYLGDTSPAACTNFKENQKFASTFLFGYKWRKEAN